MLESKKEVKLEIVVVDDSDFARQAVVDTLEEGGFKVLAQASSAKTALELAQNNFANLFIIDLVMPDASGLEVTKKILENKPETVIILMSSLKSESIVIDSIISGAIDFLQKPFKKEDLLKSCLRAKTLLSRR
jgi:two-component system, chemotaxis family, chemotaxis protein CheY